MKRTFPTAGLDAPLNEPLCIKYAAELIEMVARVKVNREAAVQQMDQFLLPEEVQYFFHTSGVKEFFKRCGGNLKLFLGLSVGKQSHKGAHAASQVACLQNLRDSYEEWQESFITRNRAKVDPVDQCWDVDLIVADTSQALNHIPVVELDLRQEHGQCMALLQDERLGQFEGPYVEQGSELENLYRELFSAELDHQEHVKFSFRMAQNPTRWGNLKKHFQDYLFIEMMNFLERCFKFGLQRIIDKKCNGKFPKEVEAKLENGDYDNWAQVVKVNDLAYVNSEIVILLSAIFKTDPKLGEKMAFALLYTGPMNMILGSGKNMLASRYNDVLCQSPCFFMQAERFGSEEKQDKNAALFLGRLDNKNRPIKPELAQRRQCLEFIQNEVGSERGLEITLAAIHQRNARKDKAAREQSKRKQEDFVRSSFCQFLDTFEHQCAQSSAQIEQCLKTNDLAWDPNNPIKCIITHLSPLFRVDENDDSSRMRHKSSLNKSGDNIPLEEDNQLITKLVELQNKLRAAITEGADVEKKQRHYLFRVVCRLVIFAVDLEKKMGDLSIRFKRSKSLVLEAGAQPGRKALSRSFECATPVYRPDPEERLMLGILYYIQRIMAQFEITLSELKNPEFYPNDKASADYVSTQEALTSSGTGFGSLDQ